MSARIELVIDEIVLHGFDPRHKHAIADAVEQGLSSLLVERAASLGVLTSRETPHDDAGSVETAAGAAPAANGTAVAHSLVNTIIGGSR